jgi:hypothetical protein
MAMMAMTTSSSISVNPLRFFEVMRFEVMEFVEETARPARANRAAMNHGLTALKRDRTAPDNLSQTGR